MPRLQEVLPVPSHEQRQFVGLEVSHSIDAVVHAPEEPRRGRPRRYAR